MGIKMMHNANISQYLVLGLCETGLTCAQKIPHAAKPLSQNHRKLVDGDI